jgi:hypothetical protein
MSLFCRQFDADPYQYSECDNPILRDMGYSEQECIDLVYRQYIYEPAINAVIRLAHENKREFDVVVYKNDNDNDGIHDRDDSCPDTPTTRAFNFVSSDGCSYEDMKSKDYKEYLYEQYCSNVDEEENHQDCAQLDEVIATDTAASGASGENTAASGASGGNTVACGASGGNTAASGASGGNTAAGASGSY